MKTFLLLLACAGPRLYSPTAEAFFLHRSAMTRRQRILSGRALQFASSIPPIQVDVEKLKYELQKYMQVRKESGADDRANEDVGKKVGGTKGNLVLEYISGAPNKETLLADAPANPLDYSELLKYGFGHLATPIMKLGGRSEAYQLLGMDPPPAAVRPKTPAAPPLVIDKTGETDPNRYSGLKMGQIVNDDVMAQALADAQSRRRRKPEEHPQTDQDYELPFADKRNTSPGWVPDWTPERLDEWGRQQGKAMSWARQAREGAFVKDPMETLDLDATQRAFGFGTVLITALGFGKSTDTFLTTTTGFVQEHGDILQTLNLMQGPAVALLLCSVGSSVVCANMSKGLNRSPIIWACKGLLGGPLSIQMLQRLAPLRTQGETDRDPSALSSIMREEP